MDLVVRAPKLPAHGETVLGGSYRTFPGGKGANQAVAAARFGAQVVFIGRLGDDAHGAKLRETLGADGVDCAHLLTSPGASGLGMITVADDGENTIVVASGANALMSAEDVRNARKAIEDADVLLMQLEIPMAANAGAIEIARSAGRSVILNTAPARALGAEVLACVDVLVMNRSEAASLVGVDPSMDPARISLRLPDLRVPFHLLPHAKLG
jgi:ribokinase